MWFPDHLQMPAAELQLAMIGSMAYQTWLSFINANALKRS
jgi:hypothetical protein